MATYYEMKRYDPSGERYYFYVDLHCHHTVKLVATARPKAGDSVWCPGHHKFGPAILTTVADPWPDPCESKILAEID